LMWLATLMSWATVGVAVGLNVVGGGGIDVVGHRGGG